MTLSTRLKKLSRYPIHLGSIYKDYHDSNIIKRDSSNTIKDDIKSSRSDLPSSPSSLSSQIIDDCNSEIDEIEIKQELFNKIRNSLNDSNQPDLDPFAFHPRTMKHRQSIASCITVDAWDYDDERDDERDQGYYIPWYRDYTRLRQNSIDKNWYSNGIPYKSSCHHHRPNILSTVSNSSSDGSSIHTLPDETKEFLQTIKDGEVNHKDDFHNENDISSPVHAVVP